MRWIILALTFEGLGLWAAYATYMAQGAWVVWVAPLLLGAKVIKISVDIFLKERSW